MTSAIALPSGRIIDGVPEEFIRRDGQAFVDQPVFALVSRVKPVVVALASAFGYKAPRDIEEVAFYRRRLLEWVTPGKDGKLQPRGMQ